MYSSHTTRSGVGLDKLFRWGDHACHFFRSADDLGEILVPYFKAGLERNEFCIWLTAHPYGRERATSEMRAAVSDFDRRAATGQIKILGEDEWYARQAALRTAEKVQACLSQKDKAIASGYAGVRGNGNASFVDQGTLDEFLTYERALDAAFKDQRIVALCSYPLDGCAADAMLGVTHCHRHGLAKRRGHWDLIEVRDHGHDILALEHEPLATMALQGTDFRALVEDQLAAFIAAGPERITLTGGDVHLSGLQARKLGIVLTELATNCAKYGALSSPQGRLAVQWRVALNGSRRLQIEWTEGGMSDLTVPDKVGFGTRLIAWAVENCVRVFKPTGMVCTFELGL